jgi:PRC-barrel domain
MENIMLNTQAIVNLVCCFALATSSLAAQETNASAGRKPGDLDKIRKVGTLIGTDVMNHSNTKIAVLRDLLLNPDGAVLYAVLGCGGVAGVGETYTAMPIDLLGVRQDNGKWAANLDMTSEALKKAPAIKSDNYRELTDPQWIARVDQFVRSHGDSQNHPDRASAAERREERVVQRVLLATKIRGASLQNAHDQSLGKVEDLLLDRAHRVAFVIIGRGGLLGIGENYIPIPWEKLRFGANRETAAAMVTIDATKAQLEMAPLVKGNNYATLLAPGFAEQVCRYFGVTRPTETSATENKN